MKIEHFVTVFFIVVATMFLASNHKVDTLRTLDNRTEEYNRNIDLATDDAMQDMVKVTDSFSKGIDLDACSRGFLSSLYASFGVMDSPTGQEELKMYLPVLLVTDEDGFYIMHHCTNVSGSVSVMQWSSKYPYYYSGVLDSPSDPSAVFRYVVNYKMSDGVSLALTYKGNTTYYEGKYKYLTALYPDDSVLAEFMSLASASGRLFNPEKFDDIRVSAMAYQITKKMNYYVNMHNEIAQNYGISYEFRLPESSTDTFARAVTDISFMAIFQGYPYGVGTDDVYSRFSLSSSRLFKMGRYAVTLGPDGVWYYHRTGCGKATEGSRTFGTKRECAEHGAYPCGVCNP